MREIEVQAELTGVVQQVKVKVGEEVAEGDTLLVMESMKMEIPLIAPEAGSVVKVLVEDGQTAMGGDTCIVLGVGG